MLICFWLLTEIVVETHVRQIQTRAVDASAPTTRNFAAHAERSCHDPSTFLR
ncbi:hypothetical protein BRCON_1808 [Candidatus Sumerlaea chitinivorans]|uniref:Uncharacterized protein n=1 Tax=Sumerlaea chitinivorans TaxID=2250252 RepID=A0A2Z4Y831_SUMC1|nr:hypothetical protein BRCON_1808 [Candidatus Sumerlaea chitinivorans]